MNRIKMIIILNLCIVLALNGQDKKETSIFLINNDLQFLKDLTKDVMESSRIIPGQKIADGFGGNSTGGTLIRPGGRSCLSGFLDQRLCHVARKWICDQTGAKAYAPAYRSDTVQSDLDYQFREYGSHWCNCRPCTH